MTWEEKLAAISAFAGKTRVALRMRKPGDWYVDAGMSIAGNGMLEGQYGNGTTPQEAVDAHWDIYTGLAGYRYAVAGYGDTERRGRWNGFMWELLTAEELEQPA